MIRFLATGQGYEITTVFCVAKVLMLYFMTVTGMAWEDEVFGRMFMAKEFFWEDPTTWCHSPATQPICSRCSVAQTSNSR